MSADLVCSRCGRSVGSGPRCPACHGILQTRYPAPDADAFAEARAHGGMWRYAPLLPVSDPAGAVTLGEGRTPLVRSRSLGLPNLWFKMESANPTGSYKDRIAAVAISRAREAGRRGWLATSSGNAGAALAAYGARAGLPGTIVVPASAPEAKLAQIRAFGPRLVAVEGFGRSAEIDSRVFTTLQRAAAANDLALSITAHAFDPWALDGAKTIAYEIADHFAERGARPDRVYVPVGGAGLASAMARGFREWVDLGRAAAEPCLHAVQADGCAPVAAAWARGGRMEPAPDVTTSISGVQLADPPDGELLLAALRRSGGRARSVSDAEVYAAQARLANGEGLFVEPAGALSVAGALADAACGRLDPAEVTVCVLTGTGLKDTAALARWPGWKAQIPTVTAHGLVAWIAEGAS